MFYSFSGCHNSASNKCYRGLTYTYSRTEFFSVILTLYVWKPPFKAKSPATFSHVLNGIQTRLWWEAGSSQWKGRRPLGHRGRPYIRTATENILCLTSLTLSCLEMFLTSVVWTFHTYENNLGVDHTFTKYLKESCVFDFDQRFSFKFFLKIAFIREISPK